MTGLRTALARVRSRIRPEEGFTLLELLMVVVLVGITSVMFEATYSAFANRSSQVGNQNVLQTEVRSSLSQLVSDLRDAAPAPTASVPVTTPITDYSASSITFSAPDRKSPPHMRRIKYFVSGKSLMRQVTLSTNTDGPPWTGIDTDSGPVEKLFGSLQNPTSVFKYCIQSPPDMTVDPSNSTSPELITWSCTDPEDATSSLCVSNPISCIKTVVIRSVVSSLSSSTQFNYGDVATLRWNLS